MKARFKYNIILLFLLPVISVTKYRLPIVLNFESSIGQVKFFLTKEQTQSVIKYYKEKKFSVISNEDAERLRQNQMAEVLNKFMETTSDQLERYKEEAQKKIMNLSESSTKVSYSFFSSDNKTVDSLLLTITAIPFNPQKGRSFKKMVYNIEKKEIATFLNIALDSCIANKFFE